LDSAGPVLFWQERVGLSGIPFRMYKFRSMRVEAEEEGASFARKKDSRITRVGSVIRRFRLDELPQFLNILMGEMSMIGPRPEQVCFARQFETEIPFYPYRHLVRPGITGWAQVNHGYATGSGEARDKLEFDLFYMKHISLSMDMLICLKTMRTILTGFGAR
jgi:lipopolysaccharide/colanic/teichoic acid biosynthesis glycosyltransferase